MKPIKLLFFIFLCFFATAQSGCKKSDKKYQKLIVGTWRTELKLFDPLHSVELNKYTDNGLLIVGRATECGELNSGDTLKYYIDDSHLYIQELDSNKNVKVTNDYQIVRISSKQLVYKSGEQKIKRYRCD